MPINREYGCGDRNKAMEKVGKVNYLDPSQKKVSTKQTSPRKEKYIPEKLKENQPTLKVYVPIHSRVKVKQSHITKPVAQHTFAEETDFLLTSPIKTFTPTIRLPSNFSQHHHSLPNLINKNKATPIQANNIRYKNEVALNANTSKFKKPSPKGKYKLEDSNKDKHNLKNNRFGPSRSVNELMRRPPTKPLPPIPWDKNPFPKRIVNTTPKSTPAKETSPVPKTYTPPSPSRPLTRSSPGAMSSNSPAKKPPTRDGSSVKSPSKQSVRGVSARDDMQSCQYCSRRFAEDRLATHQEICAKTAKKKRKVYDATKHRVQGTELESYTKKPTKTQKPPPAPVKKTDWRRKHEEFIGAIRAAKMAQAHVAKGGKLSDLPPPPPAENPDYIQCPHCGRKFNQAAAERHMPKCATYVFNKPKQTRGGRK